MERERLIVDETLGATAEKDSAGDIRALIGQTALNAIAARQENPFSYTLDDVPKGKEGLEWLVQHRSEIFPWSEREIFFDNGGGPPASMFYYKGVRDYQDLVTTYGAEKGKEANKTAETRQDIAHLLHCQPQEVAFIPNTTTGINIIAQGIDWQPGDEIIVAKKEKEYPSNYAAWLQLEKRGVKIIELEDKEGFVTLEAVKQKLGPHTRLVSIATVGWKNGQRVDVEAIGDAIHEHNAKKPAPQKRTLFNVDAIQSLGVFDLDVKAAHIDFLEAGASKWLLGDRGNGLFYCNKDAMTELPFAPIGSDSLVAVDDPTSKRQQTAAGFEVGTLNRQGIAGLSQAVKLINKVAIDNISKRVIELTDYAASKLESAGFTLISPRSSKEEKSGMIIFTKSEWEVDRNAAKKALNPKLAPSSSHSNQKTLAEKNLVLAYRDGRPRITLSYYNTKEEIDEMIRRISN